MQIWNVSFHHSFNCKYFQCPSDSEMNSQCIFEFPTVKTLIEKITLESLNVKILLCLFMLVFFWYILRIFQFFYQNSDRVFLTQVMSLKVDF